MRTGVWTSLVAMTVAIVTMTAGVAHADGWHWTPQAQTVGATSQPPGVGSNCTEDVTVWKGMHSDTRIFFSSRRIGPGQHQLPDWARTNDSPDVDCISEDEIQFVWRDAHDGSIKFSRWHLGSWTGPQVISDAWTGAGSRPSIVWGVNCGGCGSLRASYVVWRGSGWDPSIYYTYLHPVSARWTAPRQIRSDIGTDAAPSVGHSYGQTVRVVWKVNGTHWMDHTATPALQHAWSAPQEVGGGGGTSYGPSIDGGFVVWRGIEPDTRLYYTQLIAGSWKPQAWICGARGSGGAPDVHILDHPDMNLTRARVVWKETGDQQSMFHTVGTRYAHGASCPG